MALKGTRGPTRIDPWRHHELPGGHLERIGPNTMRSTKTVRVLQRPFSDEPNVRQGQQRLRDLVEGKKYSEQALDQRQMINGQLTTALEPRNLSIYGRNLFRALSQARISSSTVATMIQKGARLSRGNLRVLLPLAAHYPLLNYEILDPMLRNEGDDKREIFRRELVDHGSLARLLGMSTEHIHLPIGSLAVHLPEIFTAQDVNRIIVDIGQRNDEVYRSLVFLARRHSQHEVVVAALQAIGGHRTDVAKYLEATVHDRNDLVPLALNVLTRVAPNNENAATLLNQWASTYYDCFVPSHIPPYLAAVQIHNLPFEGLRDLAQHRGRLFIRANEDPKLDCRLLNILVSLGYKDPQYMLFIAELAANPQVSFRDAHKIIEIMQEIHDPSKFIHRSALKYVRENRPKLFEDLS
jgi:hypothetical protein